MAELRRARQGRDFPREDTLRQMLRQLSNGSIGDLLLSSAVDAKNMAIVQPSRLAGAAEMFLLHKGHFLGQKRIELAASPASLAEQLGGEGIEKRGGLMTVADGLMWGVDGTSAVNILMRWAHAHAGDSSIVALPASLAAESLLQSAERILDTAIKVSRKGGNGF